VEATTPAIARFEEKKRSLPLFQCIRCGEAGKSSANDHDWRW
jgi:hypothetical protein